MIKILYLSYRRSLTCLSTRKPIRSDPLSTVNLLTHLLCRTQGPDTATGIKVQDKFPSGVTVSSSDPSVGTFSGGVWSVPSLAPNTEATLEIVTDVNLPGTWTNRAEVIAADQFDFDSTPRER